MGLLGKNLQENRYQQNHTLQIPRPAIRKNTRWSNGLRGFSRGTNDGLDEWGCDIVGDIGARIPYALEIIERRRIRADSGLVSGYRSGVRYVWINNENIFYPHLGREALLKNSNMHAGGLNSVGEIDLGFIVPLENMVDYVVLNSAGRGGGEYKAIAESYVIFDAVVSRGGRWSLQFTLLRLMLMILVEVREGSFIKSAITGYRW